MTLNARRKPYIWATWLVGLLSGEKHCEWAPWLKAHYQYDKVDEDPSRENALSKWKADHAVMVTEHAMVLRADGWRVRVEAQNKFTYRGQVADLGGAPDVTAVQQGTLRVDDIKGGKARDEHFWQVALYGVLLPLVSRDYAELVVVGNVVYPDRLRPLDAADIVRAKPLIVDRIKRSAAPAEPARTPSAAECAWCDIANCPDRAASAGPEMAVEGDLF